MRRCGRTSARASSHFVGKACHGKVATRLARIRRCREVRGIHGNQACPRLLLRHAKSISRVAELQEKPGRRKARDCWLRSAGQIWESDSRHFHWRDDRQTSRTHWRLASHRRWDLRQQQNLRSFMYRMGGEVHQEYRGVQCFGVDGIQRDDAERVDG